MFLIYSLLFTLGVIPGGAILLWRLPRAYSLGTDWRERLGFLPDSLQQAAVARQAGGPAGEPPAPGHDRRALSDPRCVSR